MLQRGVLRRAYCHHALDGVLQLLDVVQVADGKRSVRQHELGDSGSIVGFGFAEAAGAGVSSNERAAWCESLGVSGKSRHHHTHAVRAPEKLHQCKHTHLLNATTVAW